MADKAKTKPAKRRIIRKVETVRQRAQKSAQSDAKNAKRSILRLALHYIAAPFRFIGRPFAKLGRFKVFRIIGLILLPPYFRNSWKELRQVQWPGRKESLQLTLAVLVFATIFGILVTTVDYGLDKVFKKVLLND